MQLVSLSRKAMTDDDDDDDYDVMTDDDDGMTMIMGTTTAPSPRIAEIKNEIVRLSKGKDNGLAVNPEQKEEILTLAAELAKFNKVSEWFHPLLLTHSLRFPSALSYLFGSLAFDRSRPLRRASPRMVYGS